MSRSKAHSRTSSLVTSAFQRAREAATQLRPAAEKVAPLAKTAGAAAKHRADRTRAWAAPQVEKAGQVVQHSVAPKVSTLLSAAAQRLEPAKARRRRWREAVGLSAATAVITAFAAAVRNRKARSAAAAEDLEEADDGSSAAETMRATQTSNGQRSPGDDVAKVSEHAPGS